MKINSVLAALIASSVLSSAYAQQVFRTYQGVDPFIDLGASVAAAGDVDADGIGDIVVGTPKANGPFTGCGRATVYSGRTGNALFHFRGERGSARAGSTVCGVGDIDADGHDDVAVGVPGAADQAVPPTYVGAVQVFSGADGTLIHEVRGPASGTGFPVSIAAVGDFDGDGTPDFAVGDQYSGNGFAGGGRAQVFSGSTGALLFAVAGTAAGEQLGESIAGVGDFDGDGLDDLAIGSPYFYSSEGRVRIHAGGSGALIQDVPGPTGAYRFGQSVSGAGDLDEDGVPEFFVGARRSAFAISGATGAPLYSFTAQGFDVADVGQQNVASAGDIDRDGIQDLLVANIHRNDSNVIVETYVLFVSGRTGAIIERIDGVSPEHAFGSAISTAGDLDCDGVPEVIVGAPGRNDQVAMGGEVRIYTFPTPAYYCAGIPNSTGLPGRLAAIGSTVVADDDFVLRATDLPLHSTTLFLTSRTSGYVNLNGGRLCLGGAIGRFVGPGQLKNSGATGTAELQLSLDQMPTPNALVPALPGQQWYFQAWYRDTLIGVPTSGLTDAISVCFE